MHKKILKIKIKEASLRIYKNSARNNEPNELRPSCHTASIKAYPDKLA